MRKVPQHELQHSRPNLPEDDAGDDSNGFDDFGKRCECDSPKFITHSLVFHGYYGCGGVGPWRKKEGKTNHSFHAGFMRPKMSLELLYLSPSTRKRIRPLSGRGKMGWGERKEM